MLTIINDDSTMHLIEFAMMFSYSCVGRCYRSYANCAAFCGADDDNVRFAVIGVDIFIRVVVIVVVVVSVLFNDDDDQGRSQATRAVSSVATQYHDEYRVVDVASL